MAEEQKPAGITGRIPGYSRFLVGVPVLGLMVGATTLVAMAATTTVHTVVEAAAGHLSKSEAVLAFIELADVFLLSTVLYIMALGLYELFIDDNLVLPAWLTIHSIDDLKSRLVGVVVVVLAVSFLGMVIEGAEALDLLYRGLAIAAVVAAMGYFLSNKHG